MAEPIYQKLIALYREQIQSGALKPGDNMPSEAQLSALHGISNITARRILSELSKEGYVVRKRGIGTFVAEQASAAQADKMKVISLILIYDSENNKSMDIIGEMSSWLEARGYYLCVHISNGDECLESKYLLNAIRDGVEGVIIYGATSHSSTKTLIELGVRGYPVVMLDRRFEHYPIPSVTSDNVGASRAITEYLLEKGHRRIAYVSNRILSSVTSVSDRYQGYVEALCGAGLPFDAPRLIMLADADVAKYQAGQKEEPAVRALLEAVSGPNGCTALVCLNDPVALNTIEVLAAEGVRVPDQVSVVGFDNILRAESAGLTTVHQDFRRMSLEAVSVLMERLQGKARERPAIVTPASIVERSTVAAHR